MESRLQLLHNFVQHLISLKESFLVKRKSTLLKSQLYGEKHHLPKNSSNFHQISQSIPIKQRQGPIFSIIQHLEKNNYKKKKKQIRKFNTNTNKHLNT